MLIEMFMLLFWQDAVKKLGPYITHSILVECCPGFGIVFYFIPLAMCKLLGVGMCLCRPVARCALPAHMRFLP